MAHSRRRLAGYGECVRRWENLLGIGALSPYDLPWIMRVAAAGATNKLAVILSEPRHVLTARACNIERLRRRQLARDTTKNVTGSFQENAQCISLSSRRGQKRAIAIECGRTLKAIIDGLIEAVNRAAGRTTLQSKLKLRMRQFFNEFKCEGQ